MGRPGALNRSVTRHFYFAATLRVRPEGGVALPLLGIDDSFPICRLIDHVAIIGICDVEVEVVLLPAQITHERMESGRLNARAVG